MNKKIPDYTAQFLKPDRKLNRVGKPQTFGDFVREQLNNPKSDLSERVIFFKTFVKNIEKYPNLYDFEWFLGLPIYKGLLFGAQNKKEFYNCWYPHRKKEEVGDFRS